MTTVTLRLRVGVYPKFRRVVKESGVHIWKAVEVAFDDYLSKAEGR